MKKRPPVGIRYKDDSISLLIRPLEEKDAVEIAKAVHLSLKHLLPFMDWAHGTITEDTERERIKKSRERYANGEEYELAVFDCKTGEFLMAASWHVGKTDNKKSLEIGYWTSLNHCNKGLATLVTKILTIVGFDVMECDRMGISCNKQNELSQRVIKKCGFRYEGEVRNYYAPTPEMITNGYSTERTCLQYSLLPDDCKELFWYQEIKAHLEVL